MIVLERETPMTEKRYRAGMSLVQAPAVRCNTLATKVNRNTIQGSVRLLLLSPNKGGLHCYNTVDQMTCCNESQGNESTALVDGAYDDQKKPTLNPVNVVVVAATEQVSEPMCTPECASVVELINATVDQLCFVDQDDSRGLSDARHATGGARNSETVSPQLSKNMVGWEKRGRFTIWPVSLGDDHHI